MPQPAAEPVLVPAVKGYLSLNDFGADDDLAPVVAAVNELVRDTDKAYRFGLTATTAAAWLPSLVLGGTMLAARVYRRRNSPAGVEALGVGGPVYVRRNDPDIAMLLGLDSPMVG